MARIPLQLPVELSNAFATGEDDTAEPVVENDGIVFHTPGTVDITRPPFRAVADAIQVTSGAAMTASSNVLTLPGVQATDIGKVVVVGGCGATINLGAANGGTAVPRPLRGWIKTVNQGAGTCTLVTAKGGSTAMNATTTQADTSATYGSNLYEALVDNGALATGLGIEIPAGDYIFVGSITTALPRIFGHGRKTRIYLSNDFAQFIPPAGTGRTGSAVNLLSNVAKGALSLPLASAPSGVASGDILALTSLAVWEPAGTDTDATYTTKGEFVRVQQVQGSTVYLDAPINDSYATADTAKVQKFSFADSVDFADLRFINATPDVVTYSAASPMALSQYGGGSNLFWLDRHQAPRFRNVRGEGITSAFIVMINCVDLDVDVSTKDTSRLGSFGYAVSLFGCQWGDVKSIARRSSAAFNGEGFLSAVNTAGASANMPTRHIDVRGKAFEAPHEPWLCHATTEYINFFDCQVKGGAFYQPEAAHSQGFRIAGRNCKLLRPVAERIVGKAIAISGPNCEIDRPMIRDVYPDSAGNSTAIDLSLTNAGADNTVIREPTIDGVKQTATNTGGHGIHIPDGITGTRIAGRAALKNVEGYGVYDRDSTGSTIIEGIIGVNHGASGSSFTPHLIKRDLSTVADAVPYRVISATFTNTSATYCDVMAACRIDGHNSQQAGMFATPTGDTVSANVSTITLTAGRLYAVRFVPKRDIKVASITFGLVTAAGADDAIDVGIYDAGLDNKLASSGSTTGKLNSGGGTAKNVPLSAAYTVRAGKVYYAAFTVVTPFGGTAAAVVGPNNSNPVGDLAGTADGIRESGAQVGVGVPLPSSLTLVALAQYPLMYLSET